MDGLIYKVTSPTGKVYIGQTILTLNERKKHHFLTARKKKNYKFMNALRKYGEQLKWEILISVHVEKLDETEKRFIREYDSYSDGYNSTLGGQGARNPGKPCSEETKKKLSRVCSGKKRTPESKERYRQMRLGRTHSNETKKKMSESTKNRQRKSHSEEHKRKISESLKRGRYGGNKLNVCLEIPHTAEFSYAQCPTRY